VARFSDMKDAFASGYSSGDILSAADPRTAGEEAATRASYRAIVEQAIYPYLTPSSRIFELGPGHGSWTRAMLSYIPQGELHSVDIVDVRPFLKPEDYGGRLICHQVEDNRFDCLPARHFDFFFSFGVLCHNNITQISTILANALPKMRSGGHAVHQYGDWDKVDRIGWEECNLAGAKAADPETNFWPENNPRMMSNAARESGWIVVQADLGLMGRDSVVLLRAP